MTIKYHPDLVQGSDEWHAARCGLLTASEMKLILTPTLKIANNEKEKTHLYELLAQRLTKHVEPQYISDDMLRGKDDEIEARILYDANYAPVEEMGFVTNDQWGFTLGYSPDGLIGDAGQIECKSRRQKYQVQTVIEAIAADTVPEEYMLQIQTGLLVTERGWCDFVTYSGGLPMATMRVFPDAKIQDAIILASAAFEKRIAEKTQIYRDTIASDRRFIPTERRVIQEIYA